MARRAELLFPASGGAVLLIEKHIFRRNALEYLSQRCGHKKPFRKLPLRLLVIISAALFYGSLLLAQKPSQDAVIVLKYDLHTETKTKGIVDEIEVLPAGSKKDLRELVIKSGEDKIHIYVCPQPFEEEMGISFSKGDEIAVTGSKIKREDSDVILVRELVKGTDTLVFRDSKGNPVWDPRTGK
jgi:hypothetical protein